MNKSADKPSLLRRVSPTQWVAIGMSILAIIFVFENRGKVSVEFLLITISSPMWLILLTMFIVGWVAGVLTTRRARQ
ncbi:MULTISPECIES: DUF1049 domain-containing protein [Nocardia]|uniref:DUF1049 domain-containing protein n=1 Tax=Nocardia salmonicida TaxID=53431 RepID=A0ABZ1N3D9_9NOCA|nr:MULTISPECIES: DUF1049 domain-containing protein [Nocardia]KQY37389.1 hypothetical protein ASD42_01965 [Nocardia sp. Root136]